MPRKQTSFNSFKFVEHCCFCYSLRWTRKFLLGLQLWSYWNVNYTYKVGGKFTSDGELFESVTPSSTWYPSNGDLLAVVGVARCGLRSSPSMVRGRRRQQGKMSLATGLTNRRLLLISKPMARSSGKRDISLSNSALSLSWLLEGMFS